MQEIRVRDRHKNSAVCWYACCLTVFHSENIFPCVLVCACTYLHKNATGNQALNCISSQQRLVILFYSLTPPHPGKTTYWSDVVFYICCSWVCIKLMFWLNSNTEVWCVLRWVGEWSPARCQVFTSRKILCKHKSEINSKHERGLKSRQNNNLYKDDKDLENCCDKWV